MDFDPSNMNNEEFNSQIYFEKYVINCPVHQIIAKRNHLDVEIQALNADMEGLLYDNYAKIFDASKVVSRMRKNIDKMTDEMRTLESKLSVLKGNSSNILKALQPSNERVLTLIKRKNSFSKLKCIVYLVPFLKKQIDKEDYVEAVKQYLKVEMILKKYQCLSSIAEIAKETDKLMAKIKNKLAGELDYDIYGWQTASTKINLLLRLGEEKDAILQLFFKSSQKKLDSILNDFDTNCELSSTDKNDSLITTEVTVLSDKSFKYTDMLTEVYKVVRSVFLYNRPSDNFSVSAFNLLEDFILTNFGTLSSKIRKSLQLYFAYIDDEYLSYVLDLFHRRFYSCCSVFQNTNVCQKCSKIILTVCEDRCTYHLNEMTASFTLLLLTINDKLSTETNLIDMLKWLEANVEKICLKVYMSLQNYIKPEYKYSRDVYFRTPFCKKLCRGIIFVEFMKNLAKIISKKSPDLDKRTNISPTYLLLLSKYALNMHDYAVQKLLLLIKAKLPHPTESLEPTKLPEVLISFKSAAKELLNEYVDVRVKRMGLMLRNSILDKKWMELKEPRRVSPVIRYILEDFDLALRETKTLHGSKQELQDSSSDSDKKAHFRINPDLDSHINTVMFRHISKLFRRSPKYLNEMEFTSDSILSCVLRMTLKSFLEYVRLKTFNRFGMQQIQVDVHCLQLHVMEHLKSEQDLISIFDDIISSCYNRSSEPEFMNHHVASAICQAI